MALIDKDTFEIFSDVSSPEVENTFECDDFIAPAIRVLNLKGYKTCFCCSGHPFLSKNTKHHDAIKHTNATFQWGTKSGKEYIDLEPRLSLLSERSYNEEMKKYSIRGKLFALLFPKLNNRLALFKW